MTFTLCCVGLLAVGQPPATLPSEVVVLYRRQVEVCQRLLGLDMDILEQGAIGKEEAAGFAEGLLHTARRLSDAELKLDPSPAGRLIAARRMFVTARGVEYYYRGRAERGLNREQLALRAIQFRLDAEADLRLAEAAYPANCPPVTAPFTAPPAAYRGAVTVVVGANPVHPGDRLFGVEPIAGLKRFDRLRLFHPGEATPYGELVVIDTAAARYPREDGGPPPQAFGIVLAAGGTAAAVKVGDHVLP